MSDVSRSPIAAADRCVESPIPSVLSPDRLRRIFADVVRLKQHFAKIVEAPCIAGLDELAPHFWGRALCKKHLSVELTKSVSQGGSAQFLPNNRVRICLPVGMVFRTFVLTRMLMKYFLSPPLGHIETTATDDEIPERLKVLFSDQMSHAEFSAAIIALNEATPPHRDNEQDAIAITAKVLCFSFLHEAAHALIDHQRCQAESLQIGDEVMVRALAKRNERLVHESKRDHLPAETQLQNILEGAFPANYSADQNDFYHFVQQIRAAHSYAKHSNGPEGWSTAAARRGLEYAADSFAAFYLGVSTLVSLRQSPGFDAMEDFMRLTYAIFVRFAMVRPDRECQVSHDESYGDPFLRSHFAIGFVGGMMGATEKWSSENLRLQWEFARLKSITEATQAFDHLGHDFGGGRRCLPTPAVIGAMTADLEWLVKCHRENDVFRFSQELITATTELVSPQTTSPLT